MFGSFKITWKNHGHGQSSENHSLIRWWQALEEALFIVGVLWVLKQSHKKSLFLKLVDL